MNKLLDLNLKILKEDEYVLWDKFVKDNPSGTIFHTTSWLKMMKKELSIYTVWQDEKIKAGVALIKTSKNAINGYHIPPYTQYFSPLYGSFSNSSLTDEHECLAAVLGMIKNARHVDFKLPRGHRSVLPYHWKGFESSVTLTHIISGTLDTYLANLNKNKARELKKLQTMVEAGEISIESEINKTDLHFLLQQTSNRKEFNANSDMVENIVNSAAGSFAKKIVIRSATHGLLAFGFFPYDNKAVYNLINASVRITDPVLKTINLLLLYKAIEFALSTGRDFDFEGSMLPGVEAFCRLMGGTQMPVYRVQKSPSIGYSLLRAAKQIKNDRKKM